MEQCQQTPTLNMLQHGQAVHDEYIKLIQELDAGTIKHPELCKLYERYKHTLPPIELLKKYHVYHDCGKHLCLCIDENGRRHYPNHAAESATQFSKIFPDECFITKLISMDMDFHTLKGDDLLHLCKSPFAPILYFTAWAEINANAIAFGGIDSESYKIKRSRLIQAGKKLLNN
jgi:hypothetical protein